MGRRIPPQLGLLWMDGQTDGWMDGGVMAAGGGWVRCPPLHPAALLSPSCFPPQNHPADLRGVLRQLGHSRLTAPVLMVSGGTAFPLLAHTHQ